MMVNINVCFFATIRESLNMNQEDFNQVFMMSTHHNRVTNKLSNSFVCVQSEILSKSNSDIFGVRVDTSR